MSALDREMYGLHREITVDDSREFCLMNRVMTFHSFGFLRLPSAQRQQFSWFGCLLLTLLLVSSASATQLTAWDFSQDHAAGGGAAFGATDLATGFEQTDITRGGVHGHDYLTAPSGIFWNGTWPGTGLDQYFQFSISSASSYTISDILFSFHTDPLGPHVWHLYFNNGQIDEWKDAYFDSPPSADSTHAANLNATFSGTTTFRLYGNNGSKGAGLTGLSINGTSSSVPETLPVGIFGLTTALLFFIRSRVRD